MKKLSFLPFYEASLKTGAKRTTLRLGNEKSLDEGERVMLTSGWADSDVKDIHPAHIRKVYQRRISDLNASDLEGESEDCLSPEAARLVLSCIYRRVVRKEDLVWVIKFDHDT